VLEKRSTPSTRSTGRSRVRDTGRGSIDASTRRLASRREYVETDVNQQHGIRLGGMIEGELSDRGVSRRAVLAGTAALSLLSLPGIGSTTAMETTTMNSQPGFWPNGARLAVSFSLMFEGGGQPISGAGGVIPDPIEKGVPDLPTNAFFAYGHYEGIPRVLDLMDKHGIKLSSFMIGKAVETSPDLAQEIVRRGHEAAAHGRVWDNSYQLPRDDEKRFLPGRLLE
jgi:polysaccharide deacetylase